MSPVTWGRVEKGQPVRALTYSAVDKVLRWKPGSSEAVLQGGDVVLQDEGIWRPGDEAQPAGGASDVRTSRVGGTDAAAGDPEGDTAIAVLRVIAEVLRTDLPDRMKMKIIQREVDEVRSFLDAWAHKSDHDKRRKTG